MYHPLRARPAAIRLNVGDVAPDFEAVTTHGRIRLHSWIGNRWSVLIPQVAGNELEAAADLRRAAAVLPDFRARLVQPLGLALGADITFGDKAAPFPIAADPEGRIAALYGFGGADARTVFVIDPARRIRLVLVYPPGRQRDFAETLQFIESLQGADARERAAQDDWRTFQYSTLGCW